MLYCICKRMGGARALWDVCTVLPDDQTPASGAALGSL